MREIDRRQFWRGLALAAAYAAAGKASFAIAGDPKIVSPFWPAAGLAFGALLRWGTPLWPAVFAGSFALNFAETGAPLLALSIAGASSAQAVIGVSALRRWAGEDFLGKPAGVARILGAVVLSCIVASLLGAAAVCALSQQPWARFPGLWRTWWLGDAAGAFIVAPLLLSWPKEPRRWAEAAALALVLGLLAAVSRKYGRYQLRFMLFPIMVWAGFRVGRWGVAVSCATTCYVASWLTAHGIGPLAASVLPEGSFVLQIYFISLMLCGLCVAAAVHQYETKAQQLRDAQESLQEAVRQRTALLADAESVAGLGSWRWEIQRDVVQWSDELLQLTGMEQGPDMTLRRFLDLVLPDDRARVKAAIEQALTGETFDVEFNIMRPDGQTRRLASRARVFFEGGRPRRMVGTAQDVTDKRKAELVLGLVDSLNEKERLRKEFVANVSHELRTPLASVVGYTETLLNGALDDKAVLREFLEAIHRNSSWLWRLVEDLLDLASLDAGKSKPKPEPIALGQAVETAFGVVRELAGKQGVVLAAGDGLQALVLADSVHLRRILQNALDNAIKFSDDGGRVFVSAQDEGERVTLVVRDEGCGIAAADLPSLFERFHRAKTPVDKKGTGLGLTLIKELAEVNGGGVRLESALGLGTSLFITLPAAAGVGEPRA